MHCFVQGRLSSSVLRPHQEGVLTVLAVLGRDVLQHVDVEGGVEGDVRHKLQRLVLIRRLLLRAFNIDKYIYYHENHLQL